MYTQQFIIPRNVPAFLVPTHQGRSKCLNVHHLLHMGKKKNHPTLIYS